MRDYYDGIRSGLADLGGRPHYFASVFDREADDWSDRFKVSAVSSEFVARELRLDAIFQAWNVKFHQGLTSTSTHPGRGGVDQEYDELSLWLDHQVKKLTPLEGAYTATFRCVDGQEHLPIGVWRKFEVEWTRVAP